MVMFKIMVFFTMLFGFFGVSWVWHRAWFGMVEKPGLNRPEAETRADAGEKMTGAPLVLTGIRITLSVLVAAMLIGLYLATYWLLT